MSKSSLEKKSNELRAQMDDVRNTLDDLVKRQNRLLSTGADWLTEAQGSVADMAKHARESVEGVTEGSSEGGFPWWAPVALLGVIGIAVFLYNTMMSGSKDSNSGPYPNYQPGYSPSSAPGSSTPEQH